MTTEEQTPEDVVEDTATEETAKKRHLLAIDDEDGEPITVDGVKESLNKAGNELIQESVEPLKDMASDYIAKGVAAFEGLLDGWRKKKRDTSNDED